MKTTVFALALMFTVALAANAATVPATVKTNTENAMVTSSNMKASHSKSKKAHHKKHHKGSAKKNN